MSAKEDFCGIDCYTLSTDRLAVRIMTLGATVIDLRFDGRPVLLNYATAQEYLRGDAYLGAIVGRYANRIAGARFCIGGKDFPLDRNEGDNQLHGGKDSFDHRNWEASPCGENALRLTLFSPDGDNGYPGNLTASVTYTVSENRLRIDFEGESDADTVYAPTTHMYFNLGGSETILNTQLWINAKTYLPVDAALIPVGGPQPAGGLYDFSQGKPIAGNIDHCFPLEGHHACTAADGGVEMELYTDYPALQLYTGEFLNGRKNGGFAIEPEFFPNSPNRPDFPSPLLHAEEHFHKYAEYRFRQV